MQELHTKYQSWTETNRDRNIPVYFTKGAVNCARVHTHTHTHTQTHTHTYAHSHSHTPAHFIIYVRITQDCNPSAIVNKIVTAVVQGLR